MEQNSSLYGPNSKCKHERTYYDETGEKCRDCTVRIPWCFPTKPAASKATETVNMTDTPQFDSFEEMYAFLQKNKGKKPTSAKTTVTKDAPPALTVGKIYKVIHYYLREGDTYRQLLIDAREDRSMMGDNILLKVHCHGFSDDPKLKTKCGPKCIRV